MTEKKNTITGLKPEIDIKVIYCSFLLLFASVHQDLNYLQQSLNESLHCFQNSLEHKLDLDQQQHITAKMADGLFWNKLLLFLPSAITV